MDRAYLDTDASDEVVDVQVGPVVRWCQVVWWCHVGWVAYAAWLRLGVDLLERKIQMKLLADFFLQILIS